MEDKRVAILYGILVCAIIGLGVGVLSLTLGNTSSKKLENDKTTMRVSTNTRRTTTSTDEANSTSEPTSSIEPTSSEIATSNSTEKVTSNTTEPTTKNTTKKVTTKATTKKTTKTTKKTTKSTKKTTNQVVIPPSGDRETTDESTTYPLAQDDIEWAIFDRINAERARKGFKPVKVAVDFRRLAEEGADYLYDFSDAEVRKYLYGLNNYRRLTNHILTVDQAVNSLYTATIQNTPVVTDSSIRYVGIGVIFRQRGLGDLPTYYYVIIYE